MRLAMLVCVLCCTVGCYARMCAVLYGGLLCSSQMEQAKLHTLIVNELPNNPARTWSVMRAAVVHGDLRLVREIIESKIPVYMVNPTIAPRAAPAAGSVRMFR